jgi:hypothetical protein
MYIRLICIGTTHSMPVITTAFDQDFFDEPLIESDRIESPCKRKCSKKKKDSIKNLFYLFKNAI